MKFKPRRLECTNCKREYYEWHQYCYTCFLTDTIEAKKGYQDKVEVEAEKIIPRKEVMVLAEAMEKKLRANEHKGGWDNMSIDFLTYRMRQEQAELFQTLQMYYKFPNEQTKEMVVGECADVANFVMMILDMVNKGGK